MLLPLARLLAALFWLASSVTSARAMTALLDPDFGSDGTAIVRSAGASLARRVVATEGGGLVAVGHGPGARGVDLILAAFDARSGEMGGLGPDGMVRLDLGGDEYGLDVAALDGRWIAVGRMEVEERTFALVVAYRGDGTPDVSFGDDGRVLLRPGGSDARWNVVTPTADGAILVAGESEGCEPRCPIVGRLQGNGTLDRSFGHDGIARLGGLSGASRVTALAALADGSFVIGGGIDSAPFVARRTARGATDNGFADGGVWKPGPGIGFPRVRDLAVDEAGRTLVLGAGRGRAVVTRLDEGGLLDPSYGTAGIARIRGPEPLEPRALELGPGGVATVVGAAVREHGDDFFIGRLLADGSADGRLGHGGLLAVDAGSAGEVATDGLLRGEREVVIAGAIGAGERADFALARVMLVPDSCGDGRVDETEQCDVGAANGRRGVCCTLDCRFRPSGRTCRPGAGVCDAPEVCDGKSEVCPVDRYRERGEVCRSPVGGCDLGEMCQGDGPDCPSDKVRVKGYLCRPIRGECDRSETCDGESGLCPADRKSYRICRAARSSCDQPERCDGVHDECPTDILEADGTSCYDNDPCTFEEFCSEGACQGGRYDPTVCGGYLCFNSSPVGSQVQGKTVLGDVETRFGRLSIAAPGKEAHVRHQPRSICAPASLSLSPYRGSLGFEADRYRVGHRVDDEDAVIARTPQWNRLARVAQRALEPESGPSSDETLRQRQEERRRRQQELRRKQREADQRKRREARNKKQEEERRERQEARKKKQEEERRERQEARKKKQEEEQRKRQEARRKQQEEERQRQRTVEAAESKQKEHLRGMPWVTLSDAFETWTLRPRRTTEHWRLSLPAGRGGSAAPIGPALWCTVVETERGTTKVSDRHQVPVQIDGHDVPIYLNLTRLTAVCAAADLEGGGPRSSREGATPEFLTCYKASRSRRPRPDRLALEPDVFSDALFSAARRLGPGLSSFCLPTIVEDVRFP